MIYWGYYIFDIDEDGFLIKDLLIEECCKFIVLILVLWNLWFVRFGLVFIYLEEWYFIVLLFLFIVVSEIV